MKKDIQKPIELYLDEHAQLVSLLYISKNASLEQLLDALKDAPELTHHTLRLNKGE